MYVDFFNQCILFYIVIYICSSLSDLVHFYMHGMLYSVINVRSSYIVNFIYAQCGQWRRQVGHVPLRLRAGPLAVEFAPARSVSWLVGMNGDLNQLYLVLLVGLPAK